MPKRKLSPVIYKKTKNFKKFIEKTKQTRLQTKRCTDNKTSPSTTPMTNAECNKRTLVKRREELQRNDNGCDYFKVMNTKETTMSTTCDDNVKDEDDGNNDNDNENENFACGNKQSVAKKKKCYASILTNKSRGKVDADDDLNDADDCCDDTNNHSNNNGNNKTTRVINDNNTNVASNENKNAKNNNNQSNRESYRKLNDNNSNSNSNGNGNVNNNEKQHHKLSNKANDTDGNHDDDDNDNNNDVVDNCNVDNVKYNKHHKTSKILQTTISTTTIPTPTPTTTKVTSTHDSIVVESSSHMPVYSIKQDHTDEIPSLTMSSLTSTVNYSSSWRTSMMTRMWNEGCENHKIKNCETVHHQPQQSSTHGSAHIQNSIVQQLDTFVANYKVKINYGQNSTGYRESTTNSLSKW